MLFLIESFMKMKAVLWKLCDLFHHRKFNTVPRILKQILHDLMMILVKKNLQECLCESVCTKMFKLSHLDLDLINFQVSIMCQSVLLQKLTAATQQRSHLWNYVMAVHLKAVTMWHNTAKTWNVICWYILERSHLCVQSVTAGLVAQTNWRTTKEYTLVTSHLNVTNVSELYACFYWTLIRWHTI